MKHTKRIMTCLFVATLFCGGCYKEVVNEPKSYTVDEFHMTEHVKTPDMTVKRPQKKKKEWSNLWGLF
jgi:PBP1b-binding outer membrane lipoprotein LpoB